MTAVLLTNALDLLLECHQVGTIQGAVAEVIAAGRLRLQSARWDTTILSS